MSLRAVGRLWLASSITLLGVAGAGCDDGNSTTVNTDAGSKDSGGDTDTDTDAGDTPDAGDGGTDASAPASCDALVNDQGDECPCVPLTAKDSYAEPCWMDEAHTVCGVKSSQLPGGDPTKGDQCVVRDAVGAPSTYCGDFFDQIDALMRNADGSIVYDDAGVPMYETSYTKGLDRALTFEVADTGVKLRFEGCCLPSGECGAMLSQPRALDAREPNAEGKLRVTDFSGAPFDLHLGCTSVTELVSRLSGGASTGESLPTDKLQNLPYCQYSTDGDPGVITSGTAPGVPEFVCGCGEGETSSASGLPCLQNISTEVCGSEAATTEQLDLIPEYVCGCGESAVSGAGQFPCLPNTAADLCGKDASTTDGLRATLPPFVCGAIDSDPRLPDALKIPNVAHTKCGTLPIDNQGVQAILSTIPEFLCGELESATGRPTSAGLPKLPNVSWEVCGGLPIAAESPYIHDFPSFMCGCQGNTAVQLGCLPNIERNVCGGTVAANGASVLAQVPQFIVGCGTTTLDTGYFGVCMSNTDTTVHGSYTVPVSNNGTPDVAADDCLTGVPEYAHGCGTDVSTPPANDPTCLRNTAALFGCDNVTTSVPRSPEFLCGCGEDTYPSQSGVGTNGLPCLPKVGATYCGSVDILSQTMLVALSNNAFYTVVCGCGNGVTGSEQNGVGRTADNRACLPNVAETICGAKPVPAG